jgi:hypothetical protein
LSKEFLFLSKSAINVSILLQRPYAYGYDANFLS